MARRWLVELDGDIRPLIEQIAIIEDRSAPDTVRHLLREALRERGLLPPRSTPLADGRSSKVAA
jgi:hypothetical protein